MDAGADFLARKGLLFFGGGSALVLLVIVTFFAPAEPDTSIAVGVYANPCCGTLKVEENEVVVGGQAVPYELGTDNGGLFALPIYRVGVADGSRLSIDPSQHALKLRFDPSEAPKSVTIWGSGHQPYEFLKQ